MNIEELSVELITDAKSFEVYSDRYTESYFAFVNYFQNQERITRSNLIIGINFTYGWMPTIFNFKSDRLDKVVSILDFYRINGDMPSSENLEILKECLNNSIVGTSKLLHFINQSNIPIWDSRVRNYLKRKKIEIGQVNRISSFKKYVEISNQIINSDHFEEISSYVKPKLANPSDNGIEVAKTRILEQLFFQEEIRLISKE
jgi:hypothetical protein